MRPVGVAASLLGLLLLAAPGSETAEMPPPEALAVVGVAGATVGQAEPNPMGLMLTQLHSSSMK